MKILTLNTHSLIEENYSQKLADFVSAIAEIQPEIIALQESNQTDEKSPVKTELTGYVPCTENAVIRSDNHVYSISQKLLKRGVKYFWTWLPMKNGYIKYDEGIVVMSRSPILETKVFTVSSIDNYSNWKTRRIVGIRTEALPDEWFFSVHYGWWDDKEEPFREQWSRTNEFISELKENSVWLMGDFNNPAEVRGEGYDLIKQSGPYEWYDSYDIASKKDSGITVEKAIDGWKDKITSTQGMRIDQIWCRKKADIISSEVIFNGKNYPVVSDHFGVIINYNRRHV